VGAILLGLPLARLLPIGRPRRRPTDVSPIPWIGHC
jgi:hypothetical protein